MPAVLPVTIAKEETQARLPSTKKQIYVLTAICHNRADVSTGGPALFDARNHAPNWLTPITTIRYLVPRSVCIISTYFYAYRVPGMFQILLLYTGIYTYTNNIDDAIPLPGHNYYCSKNNLYATQCYSDVLMPHNATLTCSLYNHTTR